jgi:hypothetical protein
LASFPWRHNGWLTSGHTIPFPALPLGPHATPYVACVLQDTPPGAPDLDFPPVYGDPVCLLWLIPITDAEFQYAQSTGTQALTDALWRAGCTWIHQDRKSVF